MKHVRLGRPRAEAGFSSPTRGMETPSENDQRSPRDRCSGTKTRQSGYRAKKLHEIKRLAPTGFEPVLTVRHALSQE